MSAVVSALAVSLVLAAAGEPFVFTLVRAQPVLDAVALQHALTDELKRPALREEAGRPDADWLRVDVQTERSEDVSPPHAEPAVKRRAVLTFRTRLGETRLHEVALPEDALQAVEVTALAAGTLVRNDALELAARLARPDPVTRREPSPLPPHANSQSEDRHRGRFAFSATGGIGMASFPPAYQVAVAYRFSQLSLGLDMAQHLYLGPYLQLVRQLLELAQLSASSQAWKPAAIPIASRRGSTSNRQRGTYLVSDLRGERPWPRLPAV